MMTSRPKHVSRVWVASLALLVAIPAAAANPPADTTYFVVAMGLAQSYGIQAECFSFADAGVCTLDGEICGTWQSLDTDGNQNSFAFELFALNEGRRVTLDGVARVDSRGKQSAIGGAGRATGIGSPSNFAFAGRQTSVKKCRNLLANFAGDDQDVVTGSGNLQTQERAVEGFSGVAISGVGKLIIEHTGTESLTITAEENILPLLRSDVSGDRLILGPAPGTSISNTKRIVYRLTVEKLDELIVSGVTEVEVTGIDTNLFTVNLSGVSIIKASGRTNRQDLTISGTSEYRARGLRSKTAAVNVSGLGKAIIRASDQLTGSVSGFGVVEYIGNPRVNVNVSGFGTVRDIGD